MSTKAGTVHPRNNNTNTPQAAATASSGSNNNNNGDIVNGHHLPPDNDVPDEPPPPYTAEDPQSTVIPSTNPAQQYHPPPPGAPPSHSAPPPQQPPRPSHQQQYHPPPRPPPGNYPGSHAYNSTYNGGQRPPRGNPNVPFHYPPGYHCRKCNNTGVKLKNGLSCQDCYSRFARQRNVQVMNQPSPSNYFAPFGGGRFSSPPQIATGPPGGSGPPRVVRPGDPSIGGVLCGHCRGRGLVTEFIFDEATCPTCRGVGRLF